MVNLKSMKLAGFPSNGMVMCTANSDRSKIEILRPPQGSKVGDRVTLEDCPPENSEAPPIMNPKKKLLPKMLPFFVTDSDKFAKYNGIKWTLPAGLVKTDTISNGTIS